MVESDDDDDDDDDDDTGGDGVCIQRASASMSSMFCVPCDSTPSMASKPLLPKMVDIMDRVASPGDDDGTWL
jgi:hypothetical protein